LFRTLEEFTFIVVLAPRIAAIVAKLPELLRRS
jgi:hypothetical protein